MTEDDKYLWTWKRAGISNEVIAAKMSITPEEVERRFQSLTMEVTGPKESGIEDLAAHFNLTCLQYQLLGESLKHLGAALSTPVSPSELTKEFDIGETLATGIISKYIVLHPFQKPDLKAIEKSLGQN